MYFTISIHLSVLSINVHTCPYVSILVWRFIKKCAVLINKATHIVCAVIIKHLFMIIKLGKLLAILTIPLCLYSVHIVISKLIYHIGVLVMFLNYFLSPICHLYIYTLIKLITPHFQFKGNLVKFIAWHIVAESHGPWYFLC